MSVLKLVPRTLEQQLQDAIFKRSRCSDPAERERWRAIIQVIEHLMVCPCKHTINSKDTRPACTYEYPR